MPVVAISEALQVIAQLVALVQSSSHSGEPIPKAEFDAAVANRNKALNKLDADIKTAMDEGR